jgi:hypothetical protein
MNEVFPELSELSSEEMCNRWKKLKIEFYCQEKTPVKWWLRITLPFALLLMLLMIIGLPFCFMIRGKWSYSSFNGKNHYIIIYNWFKALRLLS